MLDAEMPTSENADEELSDLIQDCQDENIKIVLTIAQNYIATSRLPAGHDRCIAGKRTWALMQALKANLRE